MATDFEIECALMAGYAYQTNRNTINWFPVPEGWTEFSHVPNSIYPTTAGFEASAFQTESNPSEIVISFAGTNPLEVGDWTSGDVPLATGWGGEQLNHGQ